MDISFVVAHGSGIDDVLWFLIPVLLAFAWLRRAEKKAGERADQDSSNPEDISTGT